MAASNDQLTIHLVRHGRTASNRARRVMGWSDESIEPDQHAAAERVARWLSAGPQPVRVVSSPLARAKDTAAPTALACRVAVEVDPRFGELRPGPWDGLSEDEIAGRWPDEWRCWRTAPERLRLPGRETLEAVYARVRVALEELITDPAAAVIVVFTHDVVVRAAVAWALDVTERTYPRIDVANCSVTTIEVRAGIPRLARLNDCCHLSDGEALPARSSGG